MKTYPSLLRPIILSLILLGLTGRLLHAQTINWLATPVNTNLSSPDVILLPDPTGNNAPGTWLVTNLACYGNVLVTHTFPLNVDDFSNPDAQNEPNGWSAFVNGTPGFGPYSWGPANNLNFGNSSNQPIAYRVNFYFLSGPPAPNALVISPQGLGEFTTATVSQPVVYRGEYNLVRDGSAYTCITNHPYNTSLTAGSTNANTVGTIIGSHYVVDQVGDNLNTGFALFQPTNNLNLTSLPSGSGAGYPSGPLTVPYISLMVTQMVGDGIGFSVGYICLTNVCTNGCLSIYNPDDIVVTTCSNSAPVTFLASVTDTCCSNCTSLVSTPPSGSSFPLGTTTVVTTATDSLNNTDSCTFTVTVLQITNPPVVTYCPAFIPLCTNLTNCASMPDGTSGLQVQTANNSGYTITQSIPAGTLLCADTTVTFTITDTCGNTVQTNLPCVLTNCCGLTINCSSNIVAYTCSNSLPVNFTVSAVDPCCSNYNLISFPPSGYNFPLGTNLVTSIAFDSCSRSNNCTFTVTVLPSANCSNCLNIQCWTNVVVASCTNAHVFYNPTATDACCTNWTVTCFPPSGSSFTPGTHVVTCRATDSCGNSNSCSFTVAVVVPIVSFTNVLVPGYNYIANPLNNPSGNTANILFPNPGGIHDFDNLEVDDCGSNTFYTVDSSFTNGWADASDSFSVTPPTVAPGQGVLYINNSGVPETVVFTGYEDCSPQPSPLCPCGMASLVGCIYPGPGTFQNITGQSPQAGAEVITFNGSSFNTNTYTGSSWTSGTPLLNIGQAVYIIIPCPTNCLSITCPSNIVVTTCSNCAPVSYLAHVTDPCCSNGISVVYNPTSGSCFPVGTNLVQVTATDACSNSAFCSFFVIVQRNGNCTSNCLSITCPTNIVVATCSNCAPVSYLAQVTDPCCSNGISVVYNPPSGSCFPLGTNFVQVTATDACSNSAFCSFFVIVHPNFNCTSNCLSITCPSNIVVTTCSNCAPVSYLAHVTDPCCSNGISIVYNPPSGNCFQLGTNLVQVTATDACSNSAFCSFFVTVLPSTNCITNCITLTCPTNIFVTTCSNCVPVNFAAQVSDLCCTNGLALHYSPTPGSCFPVGTNFVSVTATDACSNSAFCSFFVTVQRNGNCTSNCLSITCPTNIVVATCSNCVPVSYLAHVTDTCCSNGISIVYNPPSGNCFPVGTNLVQVTATDACSNSAFCTFFVTVQRNGNCTSNCLSITCPTNIVVFTCSNCAPVTYLAHVTDPCCSNGIQIHYSSPSGTCFSLGTNMVTVTANDACSNFAFCGFFVTVRSANCGPIISVGPTNIILCAGTNGCVTMPDEVHGSGPYQYALFNTAVGPNVLPQPLIPGTVGDPHWTLVSVPAVPAASPLEFGTNTQLLINPIAQWIGPDYASSWIAPANDINNDGPEGDYDFQTCFILPASDTVTISGQLAADDYVSEVLLNGNPTGLSVTNTSAGSQWVSFTLTGAGVAGSNTLDFIVHNNPLIGTNPPADNQDSPVGLAVNITTVSTIGISPYTPAEVQATNCDGTPAPGWQSIPPGTRLCNSTNITFVFTNGCGGTISYVAHVTVQICCVNPPTGMVGWFTFDQAVGDTCLNSAGYNSGLRYEGNVLATHANGPTHNLGQYVDNSLCFDGNNDKVVVPDYAAINFTTGNFSLDAWVKWNGTSGQQVLVDHRAAVFSSIFGFTWYLNNGKPALQLDTGPVHSFVSSTTLTPNVWTHLAVTVQRNSATGLKFYVNGVGTPVSDTSAGSASIGNSAPLWVGFPLPPTGLQPLYGCIDELEIFNRVLQPYEVNSVYAAGHTGKCRPNCSVPPVTTVCPGTTNVLVPVQVCNCGSTPMTFTVTFAGLSAAQAGGTPALNGPSIYSGYYGTITLPPNTCTNFTVDITIPATLTSTKVMYYQMTIKDGFGQQFSSIGEINDPITIFTFIHCNPVATQNTNVLHWTQLTNFTFVVNNPTNVPNTLTSVVQVVDGNLLPDTTLVSLNGQLPGTPATNQLVYSGPGSLPVTVTVDFAETQPWHPYYLEMSLNLGPGGALVPVAAAGFDQLIPPTVGPPLFTSVTNNAIMVTWDAVNSGWLLQTAPQLTGTNWIQVDLPVLPQLDGSQGVILPMTNQSQFFQLQGPNTP